MFLNHKETEVLIRKLLKLLFVHYRIYINRNGGEANGHTLCS